MAGPANQCSELPAQWTINNTQLDGVTPSLITNDGSAYVNGQSGVTATISTCGSNDAIVALSGSQRSIAFHFTAPLYTDQYTLSGLTGSTVPVASVNIRNILYQHNAAVEYTFTTRIGSNSFQFGPFRMVNLGSQAVAPGQGGDNVANSPYADALVYVHHCPKSTVATGGCQALAHETWYVYPDPAVYGTSSYTGLPVSQVGTLLPTVGSGKNANVVNAGEFSMPFYFAISLLN
ncbi:MAG: hypothetical protein M3O35_08500 [Acidobacteriota bacterium]|nr:hypothetical protein [Acidobacteriota bacterium]